MLGALGGRARAALPALAEALKDVAPLVRKMAAAALANGGSCEGPPGLRPNGFYAAYYRDPDGNKLNAFCIPAAP